MRYDTNKTVCRYDTNKTVCNIVVMYRESLKNALRVLAQ